MVDAEIDGRNDAADAERVGRLRMAGLVDRGRPPRAFDVAQLGLALLTHAHAVPPRESDVP
jgi:hypothetical protein